MILRRTDYLARHPSQALAFCRLYRQHGIAGFLQHSIAGFLQHAISWDANAVPTARAKKAAKLKTLAVNFFIAISYGLDWYTNRIRETLE
jgi:hypothetical protein